jgi:hypothetical protein
MFDKVKISGLYFFGYEGLDLQKIKTAIQSEVGNQNDNVEWFEYSQKIANAVMEATGKESSDQALVFFDKKYIVFVGLPGQSNNLQRIFLPATFCQSAFGLNISAPSTIAGDLRFSHWASQEPSGNAD